MDEADRVDIGRRMSHTVQGGIFTLVAIALAGFMGWLSWQSAERMSEADSPTGVVLVMSLLLWMILLIPVVIPAYLGRRHFEAAVAPTVTVPEHRESAASPPSPSSSRGPAGNQP